MPVTIPHVPVVSNPTTTNPTTTSGNTETREETIAHGWEPDLISDTDDGLGHLITTLNSIVEPISL